MGGLPSAVKPEMSLEDLAHFFLPFSIFAYLNLLLPPS